MASTPASERKTDDRQRGIALFMVITAMTILSLLVTDFVYIAQINQSMAYDSLDQVKALYLAKSGFKLSLLRLKAYQNLKALAGNGGGGGAGGAGGGSIPKGLLEKIWSFPFFYPIPTNLPGMTMMEKEAVDKFQKDSGLSGHFSAVIQSESAKYNLNLILAPFANASPSPTPSPSNNQTTPNTPQPPAPNGQPTPTPSPTPSFDPQLARQNLRDYLTNILNNKFENDEDFAAQYRDFRMDDFMDNLFAWADPSYQQRNPPSGREAIPLKKAPFYTVSELHMIQPLDDQLYDLFAPNLTVSTTPGINVNTMNEYTLRALIPGMTKDEVKAFFKFRDSEEDDNKFKSAGDFFKYLSSTVAACQANTQDNQPGPCQKDIQDRRIRIVTDETDFKITVQASVNSATKIIEAWVTLGPTQPPGQSTPGAPNAAGTPPAVPPGGTPPLSGPGPQPTTVPDPGVRVTFMRVL